MTNQEMKELYESGDWICVVISERKRHVAHGKQDNIEFGYSYTQKCEYIVTKKGRHVIYSKKWEETYFKLIHKKHEHILDAYLDGCEINELRDEEWWSCEGVFVRNYNRNTHYEAIPKTLDNCYCEASELHRDLLQKEYSLTSSHIHKNQLFLVNSITKTVNLYNRNTKFNDKRKKIQYNEQLQKWAYCSYEEKEYMTTNDYNGEHPNKDNNFKDYGFEADFDGEILKEVDEFYIGLIKNKHVVQWHKMSGVLALGTLMSDATRSEIDANLYNLTPIKKEW